MTFKSPDRVLNSVYEAITKSIKFRPLNALITETFDIANAQYKSAVDKGLDPFTMIIKDCFAVKNIPMTCASKMLSNYISPYTSTCVKRLIDKGGCLVGKGNMDEFAMGSTNVNSYYGPVKHFSHYKDLEAGINLNKINDWRVAGGSSGGCGVAVALGMARMSLGSDTGGSTRNPAAFNGVFGFKPSYGTLSRYGLVPLANSFDVPSIFANSVSDCRYFYEIMQGVDEMDSTSISINEKTKNFDKNHFKIGIPKEYRNQFLSKDAESAWNFAVDLFRLIGVEVVEVSLPHTDLSIICYYILADSDIASNMARYDGIRYECDFNKKDTFNEMITKIRTSALNHNVRRRIIAGNFFTIKENSEKYFQKAALVRRLIKNDFDAVFNQVDALLTPTCSHSAPFYSEIKFEKLRETQKRDDYFTQPANMAGLPAISIPIANCSKGYPLGVQIISNFLNDYLCLYIAELLEKQILLK